MNEKRLGIIVLVAAYMLIVACAPAFWQDGQPQPIAINPDWQCPTATPYPTEIIGYQPTSLPTDPNTTPDLVTPEPIYSTALPTSTPYVRTGGDYYMGQRVNIGGRFYLSVSGYSTEPAPESGQMYHKITIQIETNEDLPIFFDQSILRSIKQNDGRVMVGQWKHSRLAAQLLGVVPSSDPAIDISTDGTTRGGYPIGTTSRTLVFIAPSGNAIAWGISFADSGSIRDGGAGDSQVWFVLERDPNCDGAGSGATEGQPVPPAGAPLQGSGKYPVPLDTPITRGYGCHPFFTGTRGNCTGGLWWHDGIDFAKPEGTALFATRDFTIDFAGRDTSTIDCSSISGSKPPHTGFGQYVKAHDSLGYTYWYGHVLRWRVSAGQQASAGQQIADMGSTGCSTGSHLHFRVRRNGLDVNPFDVISK